MKKSPNGLSTKLLVQQITDGLQGLRRYTVVFYFLFLALVYGFVLLKVSQLINVQPSDSDVNAQVQASATPHVDAATAAQLQGLNDNSVRVQSLFDQARSNPFQE